MSLIRRGRGGRMWRKVRRRTDGRVWSEDVGKGGEGIGEWGVQERGWL